MFSFIRLRKRMEISSSLRNRKATIRALRKFSTCFLLKEYKQIVTNTNTPFHAILRELKTLKKCVYLCVRVEYILCLWLYVHKRWIAIRLPECMDWRIWVFSVRIYHKHFVSMSLLKRGTDENKNTCEHLSNKNDTYRKQEKGEFWKMKLSIMSPD